MAAQQVLTPSCVSAGASHSALLLGEYLLLDFEHLSVLLSSACTRTDAHGLHLGARRRWAIRPSGKR